MSDDTLGASGARLIEPWNERKARKAAERAASIERAAAKLRATYAAIGLPLPPSLAPLEPPPVKVRESKKLGAGRNPKANMARLAAIEAGQNIYKGKPCPRGHSGLRYVRGSDCVLCSRTRNLRGTDKRKRVRGVWQSVEIADTARTADGFRCVVCRKPFAPNTRPGESEPRRAPLYCSHTCNQRAHRIRRANG